jgi:hypothetical protein
MGSSSDSSVLGAIISVILTLVFSAVFYVWLSFALSKVFAKVGVPAWKAWVPLYNYMQLIQIGGYNPLWALAFLLPFANIAGAVFLILAIHNINKRFGLGVSYTIIAWFALPVWASIVGFGSAQWGAAPVQAPGGTAVDGGGQYQSRVEGIAPGGYAGVPAPAYPAGAVQASAPAAAAPVAPAYPAAPAVPAQPVPVAQTSALPVFSPAEPSRVQAASPVAPQAPVPPAPSSIADAMSVTPTAPPAQVRSIPDETSVPSVGFSAAAAESASANSASANAQSAGGDPWAPPINSVPGGVASAPVVSAASAIVSPPPVSVKPPVVERPVELVQAPPVAPVVLPAAPVVPPVAPVVPESVPPVSPAPLPAPDFDDTIIAEDLPDFDDTVIVGRKSPVWILEPGGSKSIRITSPVALLGRNPAVNAVFPDAQLVLVPDSSKTMSKNHARIALDDGVWTIYDLGSTNGVVLVSADGEETVLESGASAILTETFKLGELPIRLTPEA